MIKCADRVRSKTVPRRRMPTRPHLDAAAATQISVDGRSVLATVESLTAAPNDPDRATAKITVANVGPGRYTGDLPLWELTPGSPAVSVELQDYRSRWMAFVLLLAGTVVGGLLLRLAALARRRDLLDEVLDESLAAHHAVAPQPSGVVSWNLSALLDENGHTVGPREIVRHQGASALKTSIRTARTNSDLDKDATRVLDMVARIQRWLRVEPAARLLAMVQENVPQGDDAEVDDGVARRIGRRGSQAAGRAQRGAGASRDSRVRGPSWSGCRGSTTSASRESGDLQRILLRRRGDRRS
jgi:hypothetical protein